MNIANSRVKDGNFMVEQNDMINMLKGTPNFVTWIKEYLNADKIFSFKGDSRPVRKYYVNFIVEQLKNRLKNKFHF